MSITILGVNHKTAPVSLREKLAFPNEIIDKALCSLYQHPLVEGCVILSTCNRTEIYLSFKHQIDYLSLKQSVESWLGQFHHIDIQHYHDMLYWKQGQQAVEHLMSVACGIDSMVLGEPQILGQVKQAYCYAQQNNSLSLKLEKLFQTVFRVAKIVRTETKIGSNTASVAYAACLIARNLFKTTQNLNVMLVGAGDTIELIARYLKPHRFNHVIVANRTREKALKLTALIDAEIISLPDIANRLKDVDIVISSTASPLPIIGKGMVERSLLARNNCQMLFIDLAVPRDVEEEISKLDHVHLYSVDDLQKTVENNLQQRMVAAQEAQHIIREQAEHFLDWLKTRSVIDYVKQYRQNAESIQREQEEKALNAFRQGENIEDVLAEFSRRLTNKLIHAPTQTLLNASTHDCDDCFKTLCKGFGLKGH
ncbi:MULTISPECIES: glutamyl-tRNA reductase [unclassified Gilliamella]|uniref:glutamyl-tRNA reductase n=1 Tax=unclassified Gilliamella TaxID=2685620 RepID=UPI00226A094D|nr:MULTISPECIES: glutamyl-tRNA reductase [unclassified Gilliamella]MCX8574436.1 glutamyl-tRNA reductase [Gilliamella sp. B3831]MCX8576667.1 glutamyl-tRNA reductase [Gilliamella sp. B3815]MCX8589351.1 glutamyl-tRNA reductase [Gilliamella sp. B3812]MCX8603925.1 glutamyl-tRNA reductase [Gilliamella sp. B3823]MCX8606504.1 glutamyl-tRNA reductase [Gilliamella sp. B3825]